MSPGGGVARKVRRTVARSAKVGLGWTTSPTLLRSRVVSGLWGVALASPGIPEGTRSRLAGHVQDSLLRAGRTEQALRTSDAALRRIRNRRFRADLLMRQVGAELEAGTPPSLPAAVSAELAVADGLLAKGDRRGAVLAVQTVHRQLFHRRLQFDRMTSPLADDPAGFLAPWHASATVQALSAPRGRSGAPGPVPTDRPLRLLIATYGNHGFLNAIRRHFEQRPDVEVRFLDPGEDGTHVPLLNNSRAMMEHILAGRSSYGDRVREWLGPQLEWADVVFVDWCAAMAVLFSLLDPGSTRVIVRLHSFEAFAHWPHLVDFSRVDDLVFVSDHLRDLAVAAVPGMAAAGTRLHVISNAMDLRSYRRPKNPEARFTLGVVGIKAVAKDPGWAVRVLRHLRAHDDRYRLALYGHDLNADASPDARRFWDELLAEIADLEAAGAVVRMGQTEDMPEAFREVGVVVSSSVRESFHCALVEGAASGAVPVVRDWPFFAGRPASARSLFPPDWVVDSPEEAAERIRSLTATEQAWRSAGEAAAEHAIATWDWEIVKNHFDDLVYGMAVATAGGSPGGGK
ncbi:glycosyltransferase [Plantactinospora sp. WMMC1484]|uniref:glycosyltransferase n=1 Tax=Plantactinospora sp. WMMC1484 TaxID=3404122 RepID=UPI003BF579A1